MNGIPLSMRPKSISVHYDISVLGAGHFLERSRTGIFKVIEELAIALEEREDIRLHLLSQLDGECISRCIKYLAETRKFNSPYLSEASIPLINSQDVARGMMSKLVFDLQQGGSIDLGWRANYLFKKIRNKGIEALNNRRMNGQQKSMKIYQATHQPIPHSIAQMSTIVPFAMSYDMIPLLFPAYCTEYDIAFTQEMVSSIPLHGHVVTISQHSRQDFLSFRHDFDPRNVHVAYPAASDVFHPDVNADQVLSLKQKLGLAANAPYYLSVCTLEPRKNLDSVIEAFGIVASQLGIDTPYLVLAGTPGWKYGTIYEKLDRLDIHKSRVILTGYVSDNDLPVLYAGATCFLFPSLYEGFGLPPLEAMKCGTPVVCSNVSSLPEVVGDAGLLVDPLDCERIAKAMWSFTSDPELRRRYSIKSIDRAREFTWAKMADMVANAYSSAIR
jgi:glycosyltransferase involved in cell wall biosynthesis